MFKAAALFFCFTAGTAALSAQAIGEPATLVSDTTALPEAPQPQQAAAAPQQAPEEIAPIIVLPGRINGHPMTPSERWRIYSRETFGPRALFTPAIGAAISLARPNNKYPDDWTSGWGGFGRQYGNRLAVLGAKHTAVYFVGSAVKEDPRYSPAASHNVLLRTGHAIAFTFVDKSDSGHNMFAITNFAGAAAGGFVGMAYLPPGFNDATHAEQRTIRGVGSVAINNVIREFSPEIFKVFRELHLPHGGIPIPVWYTKDNNPSPRHP